MVPHSRIHSHLLLDARPFLKRRVEVELGVLHVEVSPVDDELRGGLHVDLLGRRLHSRRRYDRRNLLKNQNKTKNTDGQRRNARFSLFLII